MPRPGNPIETDGRKPCGGKFCRLDHLTVPSEACGTNWSSSRGRRRGLACWTSEPSRQLVSAKRNGRGCDATTSGCRSCRAYGVTPPPRSIGRCRYELVRCGSVATLRSTVNVQGRGWGSTDAAHQRRRFSYREHDGISRRGWSCTPPSSGIAATSSFEMGFEPAPPPEPSSTWQRESPLANWRPPSTMRCVDD